MFQKEAVPSLHMQEAFNWRISQSKRICGWDKISDHIDRMYNIQLDESFGEKLQSAVKVGTQLSFYSQAIENIYHAAKVWRNYLVDSDEGLTKLMEYGLLSMVESKAAIYSTYFLRKDGFVLRDVGLPQRSYALLINFYGDVREIR